MPIRPSLPRQIVLFLPHRPFCPFPRWQPRRPFSNSARQFPPADSAASAPVEIKALRKKEHLFRNSVIKGVIAATIMAFWLDGKYNARAVRRTLRTVWVGALLAADYKWNFTCRPLPVGCGCIDAGSPEKADEIEALHKRVAGRIMDLISANGGLYIKLGNPPAAQTQRHCSTEGSPQTGQALAMQAAVLPPVYGEAFSTLFDEAPQMSYEEVEKVFKRDFDKLPAEMFDVFERDAKASASIASVFKARLKSGEWVAVKVQKPEIEKQVEVYPTSLFLLRANVRQWDLFAYRYPYSQKNG